MLGFARKAVIITGASSGIGEATALAFARDGAKLTITGRNKKRLGGVAEECKKFEGCEVHEIVSDLSVFDNLKPVIDETVEKFKKIDILVNNATARTPLQPVSEVEPEKYDNVFNTNLRAPVFLSQLALPYLKKSQGCVVNVSSSGSDRCYSNNAPYCMSKSALDHFTRGIAAEYAAFGVRVNTVNPPVANSKFHLKIDLSKKEFDDVRDKYQTALSNGIIPAEEIANAILFACSARYMTGNSIFVDGGSLLNY